MFGFSKDEKLVKAVKEGALDKVAALIEAGANVNACDKIGDPILYYAVEKRYHEMPQLLLEKGANVYKQNQHGKTALFAALNDYDLVKLLLDKRADVNAVDLFGNTPLYYAVEFGKSEIIELLLDRGAYLNAVNLRNETALHHAARNCRDKKTIDLLLYRGADTMVVSKSGYRVLHYAAMYENASMVEALLARGDTVHATDRVGNTALHFAVQSGNLEIVKLLLDKGARADQMNGAFERPLDLAKKHKRFEVAKYIEDFIARKKEEKIKREVQAFQERIEASKERARRPIEIYRNELSISSGQQLVEIFNFARRTKTSFVQMGKVMSPPAEISFDDISNQVVVLRPIWEAYQTTGGHISEDSIYPNGVQKIALSSIGIVQKK